VVYSDTSEIDAACLEVATMAKTRSFEKGVARVS
jgi:hypothetical protein